MSRRFAPLLLLAGACGPVDNVAACREWAAASSCGPYHLAELVDCASFEGFECDASDYFACLAERTTCDAEGYRLDTTAWDECDEAVPCE